MNPIHLVAGTFTVDASASDGPPSRSITGLAVPWNVATTDSLGQRVMFKPGSLPEDGRPPKLVEGHDLSKIRGLVTERANTSDGMMFTARLADTRDAQDTMALLQMGAIDAVSVGVVPTKFAFDKNGTMVVEAANWQELSLVAVPAFEDARIASVTASAPENEPDEEPTPIEPEEDSMHEDNTPALVEASAPAVIPTEPIWAQPRREFKLPSPAEYIATFLRGGNDFAVLNDNIRKFAAPDVVTNDLPGVLPTPVVSPVYNNFRGIRPVIDNTVLRAMPQAGKVFIRPKVTTHTTIGAVTQGNTIPDGTFVIDDVPVTKAIYGGYVQLSEASIDWSSPEVLSALLDDMGRIYADQTDAVAAGELESGTSQTEVLANGDLNDPAKWVAWIYTTAQTILTNSNGNLPTHLYLAPDMWGSLGQLADDAGRPLFPQAGPMNAFGQMSPGTVNSVAFGLQVVVDRNLSSGTAIVGNSDGFECWEQQKGAISIENPSLLARTIAWRGYFAPVMIDETKFVARVAS
jgi:HK97 family phage prohead protease